MLLCLPSCTLCCRHTKLPGQDPKTLWGKCLNYIKIISEKPMFQIFWKIFAVFEKSNGLKIRDIKYLQHVLEKVSIICKETCWRKKSVRLLWWSSGWVCSPNAEGPSSTPDQGIRSHMPQLKTPHAATKTQHSQINNNNKGENLNFKKKVDKGYAPAIYRQNTGNQSTKKVLNLMSNYRMQMKTKILFTL